MGRLSNSCDNSGLINTRKCKLCISPPPAAFSRPYVEPEININKALEPESDGQIYFIYSRVVDIDDQIVAYTY